MGWFKRLKNHTESVVFKRTNETRDEKQIEEIIEELNAEMAEAQIRITNLTATVNDERERAENLRERATRRHDEAKLAVLHGDDDAARRALAEEQSFKEQFQEAIEERKKAEETLFSLRERLQVLENQVHGLSTKKDEYLARLRTAELAKMAADIKGGIDSRGRVFERLEEKALRKELEAEAHMEVAGLSKNEQEGSVSISAESDKSVEEMLKELQTALKEEGPKEK